MFKNTIIIQCEDKSDFHAMSETINEIIKILFAAEVTKGDFEMLGFSECDSVKKTGVFEKVAEIRAIVEENHAMEKQARGANVVDFPGTLQ